MDEIDELKICATSLEMSPGEFRKVGYQVVDQIATFLDSLPARPVMPDITPQTARTTLNASSPDSLPMQGKDTSALLAETADLLFANSTFNGHPGFMGWVTSSAAPIGALGDFLASAINPNVGLWLLAPIATEIEAQTIRWMAELIGYPVDCGGLLVSGGTIANFLGLLTARKAKVTWDVRSHGLAGGHGQKLRLYATTETHAWVHKAADLFGLGLDAIRWVPTDAQLRMDVTALRAQIQEDRLSDLLPFLVVGNVGTTSTGAVDPLLEIATICREYDLWFHVDAAYGGFAAMLLDSNDVVKVPSDLRGLSFADSVAIDPHKWLYTPLEAGCTLVRNAQLLRDTFSPHNASYFHCNGGDSGHNYLEYGIQSSRGFHALKVWLALRQVGREGYMRMLSQDIALAQALYQLAEHHPELHAFTHNLSVTTLRYVPSDLTMGLDEVEAYLNLLNKALLNRLWQSGNVLVSNAVVRGIFLLRACIVNFRTRMENIEELIVITVQLGREIDAELRPTSLQPESKTSS